MFRRLTFLIALATLFSSTNTSHAGVVVTVLFEGFSGSSATTSGMDALSSTLAARVAATHPSVSFSSRVFQHFEQGDAINYINSFSCISGLVIIGHSLGGDSVIELAEDLPYVDLTVQIDSVGIGDDALPPSVGDGFNYYQISTDLFEPQGELFVSGATNINVETLFGDPSITHTSIDDDSRLHDEIFRNIQSVVLPEPASLVIFVCGGATMLCLRRRRK